MRAALYARFSTDLQNVGSIADQFAACREHARRLGASVVAEFSDAAISGASANRPGLIGMMAAAKAGAFDVVIAEALDRLTRSGGDAWDIYEDLKAAGVSINTMSEGEAQSLHIGLKGTMNALFLEELSLKTRRGMAGVARDGRSAGGRSYGYRMHREIDAQGQYVAGLRTIDPDEAELVRRIFQEYAAGASPREIAAKLNQAGLPGPRGGGWNASTINGNAERGNGVIHNELYRGVMVWGRQTWVKDRRTGKRRSKTGDKADVVRHEAPELRIVDETLWHAVQARIGMVAQGHKPHAKRRPKGLLSGLVRCGLCDGGMTMAGPDRRLICTTRREQGLDACANNRTAKVSDVEARVLASVRDNLLHPAVIEAAVKEFQLATAARAGVERAQRSRLERELEETKRRAMRLVDQVADGILAGEAVSDRLKSLEVKRAQLEAELSEQSAEIVDLHPSIAGRYRQLVEDLQSGLQGEGTVERNDAREAFRTLITAVRLIPAEGRGQYEIEIEGDLATLLRLGQPDGEVRIKMGAGTGFEPVTFRL